MGFSIRRNRQSSGVSLTNLRNPWSSHALGGQQCRTQLSRLVTQLVLSWKPRSSSQLLADFTLRLALADKVLAIYASSPGLFFLLPLPRNTTDCHPPLFQQPLSTSISEESLCCRGSSLTKQSSSQNRILTLMSVTCKVIPWHLAWASWVFGTGGWLLTNFTPFFPLSFHNLEQK